MRLLVIMILHLKEKAIIMKLMPFWRSFCKWRVVLNYFVIFIFSPRHSSLFRAFYFILWKFVIEISMYLYVISFRIMWLPFEFVM